MARKKKQILSILNKNGKKLMKSTYVCDRWKEYIEEIYHSTETKSTSKRSMTVQRLRRKRKRQAQVSYKRE